MNESDTLRELDAEIMDAFANAGLASSARHRSARTGAETDIIVLRDPQIVQDGPATFRRETMSIQRADVTPAEGDTVAIGSERWRLVTLVDEDDSVQQWAVARVAA